MNDETRRVSGVIFLTVPSIMYGGYFLLTILSGQQEYLQLTDFQKAMFRAGHAHAGVLVILSLVVQIFADHVAFQSAGRWFVRIAFPVAAILVSGGFFAAAIGNQLAEPNSFIVILYAGVALLAAGLIALGIGLIKRKPDVT